MRDPENEGVQMYTFSNEITLLWIGVQSLAETATLDDKENKTGTSVIQLNFLVCSLPFSGIGSFKGAAQDETL